MPKSDSTKRELVVGSANDLDQFPEEVGLQSPSTQLSGFPFGNFLPIWPFVPINQIGTECAFCACILIWSRHEHDYFHQQLDNGLLGPHHRRQPDSVQQL